MTQANVSAAVNNGNETVTTASPVLQHAPEKGRLIVMLVEVALVGLLAYLLVSMVYDLIKPTANYSVALANKPTAITTQRSNAVLQSIVGFDPFYRAAATVLTPSAEAPESALNITITGLRFSEDGTGAAIIDTQDGGQKLVAVGGEISRGITLSKVFTDRIEINRRGARETVYMTRPSVDPSAYSSESASDQSSEESNDPATYDEPTQSDYSGILANISLEPVRADSGRIDGFRVLAATESAILTQTNLEVGDVIKSVNGSRLSSFERMQELSEELASASTLVIEIERRGEQLTLTL